MTATAHAYIAFLVKEMRTPRVVNKWSRKTPDPRSVPGRMEAENRMAKAAFYPRLAVSRAELAAAEERANAWYARVADMPTDAIADALEAALAAATDRDDDVAIYQAAVRNLDA